MLHQRIFQLSICLPRKLATVCASVNSMSEHAPPPFWQINSTQPITSPSDTTGAATDTQNFSSPSETGIQLPPW